MVGRAELGSSSEQNLGDFDRSTVQDGVRKVTVQHYGHATQRSRLAWPVIF
jgi:hypothetical protein